MEYKIVKTDKILIVGLSATANFLNTNQITGQLARQFMPRVGEVIHRKDNFKLSLHDYSNFNISEFNPNQTFQKWIGVEVNNLQSVPGQMETLTIYAGKYLVINFEGTIEAFVGFWQDLHFNWLPNSEFDIDNRPHFERLGPDYNPNQAVNKEEIWIPIK
ncbi:GyrI-like domain-containing protein [Mesoflavibacter sp. CH_XMU1404-2]|uniref:GyrI-like domain-containing protein n=1 Tax=Mesoflavibacter sp. CH_XMU1404-2 TaxID=3107766 RepID=UPI0030093F1F